MSSRMARVAIAVGSRPTIEVVSRVGTSRVVRTVRRSDKIAAYRGGATATTASASAQSRCAGQRPLGRRAPSRLVWLPDGGSQQPDQTGRRTASPPLVQSFQLPDID